MKVNTFMVDVVDMDEKLSMIEQATEALKKYVDDKDLHFAKLMNKFGCSGSRPRIVDSDSASSSRFSILLRAFGARGGRGGRLTDSDLTLAFSTAGASSSSLFPCTCDVFFSFTGEDVQKNFVDHLYRALQQRGIHTFKDEKPERGKSFSPSLFKAIEESMISIIIFSQNYIASSWCLDELVKITECMKFRGQIVLHLL
ncbi:hypothetical protein BC332_30451 [Capsicum chinense]|nr:hypothetical protein BC332_30451 [Capsicum chinense]